MNKIPTKLNKLSPIPQPYQQQQTQLPPKFEQNTHKTIKIWGFHVRERERERERERVWGRDFELREKRARGRT